MLLKLEERLLSGERFLFNRLRVVGNFSITISSLSSCSGLRRVLFAPLVLFASCKLLFATIFLLFWFVLRCVNAESRFTGFVSVEFSSGGICREKCLCSCCSGFMTWPELIEEAPISSFISFITFKQSIWSMIRFLCRYASIKIRLQTALMIRGMPSVYW